MFFGLNGWVPVGRGWVEKWENDFEYHRLSDVTRNMRSMAEEFKVTFGSGLKDWEGELYENNMINLRVSYSLRTERQAKRRVPMVDRTKF